MEKKTERLYVRTTPSVKLDLQYIAKLKHGGNVNALIDVALAEYIKANGGGMRNVRK